MFMLEIMCSLTKPYSAFQSAFSQILILKHLLERLALSLILLRTFQFSFSQILILLHLLERHALSLILLRILEKLALSLIQTNTMQSPTFYLSDAPNEEESDFPLFAIMGYSNLPADGISWGLDPIFTDLFCPLMPTEPSRLNMF